MFIAIGFCLLLITIIGIGGTVIISKHANSLIELIGIELVITGLLVIGVIYGMLRNGGISKNLSAPNADVINRR
jgi:hypothetical protein